MRVKTEKKQVATVTLDKVDSKPKMVTRDNLKSHYIMKRKPLYQEDITVKNMYAPKTGAPT